MGVPPSGESSPAPDPAALHLVSEIYGYLKLKNYESGFKLLCCLIVWIMRVEVHYRYDHSAGLPGKVGAIYDPGPRRARPEGTPAASESQAT